ncbi:NusG domain II-containing protein [Hominifimenecus sp. rT4P-3]|uniref:NusG domain II-containing protein n=1 Tax=Hominifimenecus sp. rT4P-3 TaxID=3242979 RepID=UPI003DA48D54
MRRGDWFLMGSVALLAGAALLLLQATKEEGAQVIVEVDGVQNAVYSLSEERTVTIEGIEGGTNQLVIEGGAASVVDASCPDHLCVHQSSIRYQGQTIVCLPNRVVITVENGEEAEIDGMVGAP